MNPPPTSRSPLRISGPDALPVVLPHLLGFEPARSFVVLGLAPGHDAVVVSLRIDLPDAEVDADVVQALACYAQSLQALIRAGASDAIVALMPGRPGEAWADVVGDDLPLRGFAADVEDLAVAAGVHVRDLVCVVGPRVASYYCHDPACCPPEGRAASPEEALRVRAALVAMGSAPLPSREALVAALAPREAGDPLVAEVRARRDGVLVRTPVGAQARVEAFLADARRWGARPGSASALARLVILASLLCGEIAPRDLLLRRIGLERDRDLLGAVRSILGEAVRCAADRGAAPPAAVLAVAAWVMGDGAAARVAVDRALDADPGHSLARLVQSALDQGVPPWAWRELAAGLSEEEILDASPPGQERWPA